MSARITREQVFLQQALTSRLQDFCAEVIAQLDRFDELQRQITELGTPPPASEKIVSLAPYLARSDPAMAARQRKRRYRQRMRSGEVILRITTHGEALADALIETCRLTPTETLDRHAVEAAAAAILGEWVGHWRKK
jgi:hypothetical protein